MAQKDKTDKETQTKKRDKSRDKAKPGGRLPAYCGASCGARFSRSPPRQTTQTLNLVGLDTLEVSIISDAASSVVTKPGSNLKPPPGLIDPLQNLARKEAT